MTDTKTMTAAQAETYLQSELGQPNDYWRVFLQNNRRPDRRPTERIPYSVQRGRPVYRTPDLERFVSAQKNAAGARGQVAGTLDDALRAIGGWPTGRPFVGWITPQVEEGTGVTFVRIHLSDPLRVYRLDPEQARDLAKELLDAAAVADRAAGHKNSVDETTSTHLKQGNV